MGEKCKEDSTGSSGEYNCKKRRPPYVSQSLRKAYGCAK